MDSLAEFTLEHPGIGVSVNKLYGHRGARVFLTNAGRSYKDGLRDAVAKRLAELSWAPIIEEFYQYGGRVTLDITLFADLTNPTWKVGGGSTKGGARRSPYRKFDASNYVKLIEDAISEATGIDDSAIMDHETRKRQSMDPRVLITYRVHAA